jgi:hypothetical protein
MYLKDLVAGISAFLLCFLELVFDNRVYLGLLQLTRGHSIERIGNRSTQSSGGIFL